MGRPALASLLALILTLGCVASGGDARALAEEGAQPAPAAPKKDAPAPAKEAPKGFAVTIVDTYGVTHDVHNALVFAPAISLFGGGEEEGARTLQVKRGAGDIEVDLARVTSIEVTSIDKERISLKITFRPGAPEGEGASVLEGSVKLNLEMRGETNFGNITLKLREVKKISFEQP
jgi:hypothetical protein